MIAMAWCSLSAVATVPAAALAARTAASTEEVLESGPLTTVGSSENTPYSPPMMAASRVAVIA